MRYDREAVISLYKYYTQPKGLWGRELINMRKSTRSVNFHILINECPHPMVKW